jgi:hypothetical protein
MADVLLPGATTMSQEETAQMVSPPPRTEVAVLVMVPAAVSVMGWMEVGASEASMENNGDRSGVVAHAVHPCRHRTDRFGGGVAIGGVGITWCRCRAILGFGSSGQ